MLNNVLLCILCANVIHAANDCLKLDVSVTQRVENDGFHRDLKWLIELLSPDNTTIANSACRLSLRVDVSPGMFVNPDELADLNRLGKISTYVDGDVNTETPAHESTGHVVYVFLPTELGEKIFVNLPIHLRYQRAQITGGYGKVSLPKPSLLAYVPSGNLCGELKTVRGPCDVNGARNCDWKNVSYQVLFGDVDLFVPIGDLDDYPLVSIVTLLLGCAGCIYVLSILSTTHL